MDKPELPDDRRIFVTETPEENQRRFADIMKEIGIDFDEVENFEHTEQGDFTLTRFLLKRKARGDSRESINWMNESIKRLCEAYPYAGFTSIYGAEASYVGGEIKNIFHKGLCADIVDRIGNVYSIVRGARRKCFRYG
jgi:hypothetical protein